MDHASGLGTTKTILTVKFLKTHDCVIIAWVQLIHVKWIMFEQSATPED